MDIQQADLSTPPRDCQEAVRVTDSKRWPWIAGGCSVSSDTAIVELLRKHQAKE